MPVVTPWDQQIQEHNSNTIPPSSMPQRNDQRREASYFGRDQFETLMDQQNDKAEDDKPSAIEDMYSTRIVDELSQFGYDLFGIPDNSMRQALDHIAREQVRSGVLPPAGAMQDSFLLQMGDEVEIVLSGQRNERNIYKIDNQGFLLLPDFPPIPAAGRTIGQVRISLQAAAQNMYNTQSYISLAAVSHINVLVVGHVEKPGRKNMTVFHSVLDALMQSGGITKTGSLRQIKLVRDGRSTIIDLYGLLMHGGTGIDYNLRDGDRIIIPPLGPTVAIASEVKRPGIYEILPQLKGMRHRPEQSAQKISLNDMLDFAGGVLSPGANRFLKLGIAQNGYEQVSEASDPFLPSFGDGDILMISKGLDKRAGTVQLSGHTRKPGIYSLKQNTSLTKLLDSAAVLGKDIYPLMGVIERWDNQRLTTALIDFPLQLVISRNFDRTLMDGDVVHLFSNQQIADLDDKNERARQSGSETLMHKVAMNEHDLDRSMNENDQGSAPADHDIIDETMRSFLIERSAFVRGAVREQGAYPVAKGVSLDGLLAVAGGLSLEANTSNIEVTSAHLGKNHQNHGRASTQRQTINMHEHDAKTIAIAAGDSVRVNQKFKKISDQSVLIVGEVRHPGKYDLMPGDKLSDLLARAGGLNQSAYPEGAIFSRESARRAEQAKFKAMALDLQRRLALQRESEKETPEYDQIVMVEDLIIRLNEAEALGRITVEAHPGILANEPELDVLLERGDRIYIPKRPMSVRVSGEVLSPATLQFRSGKKPSHYIQEAGGLTYHADSDRSFVIYPDGSAQPISLSHWSYNPMMIIPGSTIVIPRDPKPFDFIESAKDVTQILSNLAMTAIFIDDIRDSNN